MNKFEQIKQLLADTEKNADQFYGKKVKAAGTRLRANMQDLKTLANEVRVEVLETIKAGKDS